MGRPPQRIDAQRAPAPEFAQRERGAHAARQQPPREPEAADDQEEPDALVAGPADPAHEIQRDVEPAVSREWRELRDAVGEGRPVRGGIAGEREPEQALDDVVPDDPDERRGLQDLDPGESDHA